MNLEEELNSYSANSGSFNLQYPNIVEYIKINISLCIERDV